MQMLQNRTTANEQTHDWPAAFPCREGGTGNPLQKPLTIFETYALVGKHVTNATARCLPGEAPHRAPRRRARACWTAAERCACGGQQRSGGAALLLCVAAGRGSKTLIQGGTRPQRMGCHGRLAAAPSSGRPSQSVGSRSWQSRGSCAPASPASRMQCATMLLQDLSKQCQRPDG
eukprot:366097-Chlamydomonas_euryale.AAC.35